MMRPSTLQLEGVAGFTRLAGVAPPGATLTGVAGTSVAESMVAPPVGNPNAVAGTGDASAAQLMAAPLPSCRGPEGAPDRGPAHADSTMMATESPPSFKGIVMFSFMFNLCLFFNFWCAQNAGAWSRQ